MKMFYVKEDTWTFRGRFEKYQQCKLLTWLLKQAELYLSPVRASPLKGINISPGALNYPMHRHGHSSCPNLSFGSIVCLSSDVNSSKVWWWTSRSLANYTLGN